MAKKKNAANVSVGKPKAGGAVFAAPAGTALPSDATSELPDAFTCLGCISEDGVVNTQEIESEDFVDWEGDTVESAQTSFTETYQMTFIEALNPDMLRAVYGDAAVTVGESGGVTVLHTGADREEVVLVIDTLLKGNRIDRLAVPRAKFSELGDVTRARSELIGYEVTFKALYEDSIGACTAEYISEAV